jgi:hypothetical protein
VCLGMAGRGEKGEEDFDVPRYSEISRAPRSRRGSSKRTISGRMGYMLLDSLLLLSSAAIYLLNRAIELLSKRSYPPHYNRTNGQAMKAGS